MHSLLRIKDSLYELRCDPETELWTWMSISTSEVGILFESRVDALDYAHELVSDLGNENAALLVKDDSNG